MTARIDDYRQVAPPGAVDIILKLAERVRGKRFLHLSAGRFGGGAAEALQTLVPLLNDVGVDTAWEITGGDQAFYATSTALHAAMEGGERVVDDESLGHWMEMNRINAKKLRLDADFVMVHDVQPASIIGSRPDGGKWLWQCHFDCSAPLRRAWSAFRPLLEQYDAAVFALPRFGRRLGVPQY